MDEWFNGRFWLEWVVGRKNKPTEVRSKQIILAVLSKPLRYAADCNVIAKAPKVGLFKVPRRNKTSAHGWSR